VKENGVNKMSFPTQPKWIKIQKAKLIILDVKEKIRRKNKRIEELEKTDEYREWKQLHRDIRTLNKHIDNNVNELLRLIR